MQDRSISLLTILSIFIFTSLGGTTIDGTDSSLTTNVALNKTATQSSTKNGGLASRAVDGNTNGSFYHPDASVSSTNYEEEAWWEVDLGGLYDLSEMSLWNQTGGNSTEDYYVLISEVPFPSTDLTTCLNDPQVTNYYNSGTMGSPSITSLAITGRYIRIQGSDWGFVTLAEVEVLGVISSGGPSVTINAPVNVGEEFNLDINFNESVTGLNLEDFSILNAGISNLTGSGLVYSATIIPDANPVTIYLPEGVAIDVDGNLNSVSNELTLNYSPPEDTTINLAVNKTATQSSVKNGGVASRAVDGNTNGAFYHPDASVSSTNYEEEAWWEVDLGAIYTLEEIESWNQTGGNSTQDYYVLVSDLPFPSTDLATCLSDPAVSSYYDSGTMGSPSISLVNRTGRYIRIQGNDWGFVTMAEVKAKGFETAPVPNNGVYSKLKKQLDGSYVRTINEKLYFQHIENYAIVSGENRALKYKIYDWKKELKQVGALHNSYGPNWFVVSPNAQLANDFYILEVSEVNKNETYYLRFQYIPE